MFQHLALPRSVLQSANNMQKGARADRPGLVSAIHCIAAVPNCSICMVVYKEAVSKRVPAQIALV